MILLSGAEQLESLSFSLYTFDKSSVSFLVGQSWRFLSWMMEHSFFFVTTLRESQNGISGVKLWRPEIESKTSLNDDVSQESMQCVPQLFHVP